MIVFPLFFLALALYLTPGVLKGYKHYGELNLEKQGMFFIVAWCLACIWFGVGFMFFLWWKS